MVCNDGGNFSKNPVQPTHLALVTECFCRFFSTYLVTLTIIEMEMFFVETLFPQLDGMGL